MGGEGRLRWSALAAFAIHAAVIAGVWRAQPPGATQAPAARRDDPIDLTVEATPVPVPMPATEAPHAAPAPTIAAPALPLALPRHPRAASAANAPPAEGDGAASPGHDGAGPPGPVAGSGAAVATAAPPPDALPPPLVPRAVRAPSAVLDEPLAQRAAAAGLGAGAQVIGAARSVADAKAPSRGHGSIDIETDAEGNVVRVTSTSPSWEAFARELQAKLAGKRLRVPPGARGVAVRLAVSADVTSTPALLTGEKKAEPCRRPEHQRDQAGRADVVLDVGCVDWTALVPLPRRRTSVSVAGERSL
jgi:hypothetical protein